MGSLARTARKHNALDIEYEVDEKDCWNVTSHSISRGYPAAFIDGKPRRLHQYSYELHNGKIPEGMCVCHKCDNKMCVNPSHFFLGTKADNNRDAKIKGRIRHGETHYRAKLNEDQVKMIRKLVLKGVTKKSLGNQFGVAECTIYNIIAKRQWAWV